MKYKQINKRMARKMFDANQTVLLVGDNVNSFHFESGWHLAYSVNKTEKIAQDDTRDFEWHLERELGRRAAYYLRLPLTQTAHNMLYPKQIKAQTKSARDA